MLIKEFFDFIHERQLIWYKRFVLKENFPWTGDKILQKYKILNVYRELDKGTKYILDKLKNEKSREKILLNIVFYRFFNKYNFYENLNKGLLETINKKDLLESLEILKKKGNPLFNDAYLIAGEKGKKKHISVIDSLKYLERHMKEIISKMDNSKTPKVSFEIIKEIPLVGNFLAYEIWTDLTYFDFFKQGWTDEDFVNIGPGASWGLKIIFGKELDKKSQMEKIKDLHKIQEKFLDNVKWKNIFYQDAFSNKPFLSLRNIEHSLCEFRKYWRLKQGKGKKRYYQH